MFKSFNGKTFISEMATDIEHLALILNQNFKPQPMMTSLTTISGLLRKNKSLDYKSPPLELFFTDLPRHISHEKVEKLRLYFSVDISGDHNQITKFQDPFNQFEFNISIYGINADDRTSELVYALHFDRHIQNENDEPSDEVHPVYHIQFGGRKIKEKKIDFGQALFFDAPRIMHHPMEFILGLDFVLSNFFPVSWDKLRRNGTYVNLIKKYQEYFVYPYFKVLSDYFVENQKELKWGIAKNQIDIYPQLIPRR